MEESAMRAATWAGVALMIVLGVVVSAPHADSDWVKLGERTVNHSVDHDQIVVTKSEGDFHRIALRVEGAPVQFYKVEVHYANGQVQNVELKDEIPAGGESRAIDLTGRSASSKAWCSTTARMTSATRKPSLSCGASVEALNPIGSAGERGSSMCSSPVRFPQSRHPWLSTR